MTDVSKALTITGWMSERELRWLAQQAASRQCIVEIGSYMGRSTKALASTCRGTVFAIDKWGQYRFKWKNGRVWPEFQRNLAEEIATGKVVAIRGKTPDAWRALDLALKGQRPDMIFIDGDHRFAGVASDCVEAWQRLAPGGLLCGHDYGAETCPQVKPAVDVTFGGLPILVAVDTIFEVLSK